MTAAGVHKAVLCAGAPFNSDPPRCQTLRRGLYQLIIIIIFKPVGRIVTGKNLHPGISYAPSLLQFLYISLHLLFIEGINLLQEETQKTNGRNQPPAPLSGMTTEGSILAEKKAENNKKPDRSTAGRRLSICRFPANVLKGFLCIFTSPCIMSFGQRCFVR